MVSSLASLVESSAITCKSTKTDAIDVVVLQDGTATCFDHREAVKAEGYMYNVARKEWGRCAYTHAARLSGLLKMGILTASVQDNGALVVSNGFGNTFDARRVIVQKGFRWDKASKTYRLVDATQQQRDAVHAINKEVAMRRERTSQVTRQKRLREKKKTFDETIEIIDQAMNALMAQKWAACYVGVEFQPTYTRGGGDAKTISKEEYSKWLSFNQAFISHLPTSLSEWTSDLDLQCQRRCIDVRVDRANGLIAVEYPH